MTFCTGESQLNSPVSINSSPQLIVPIYIYPDPYTTYSPPGNNGPVGSFYSPTGYKDYQWLIKIKQANPNLKIQAIVNINFEGSDWTDPNQPYNYRNNVSSIIQSMLNSNIDVVGYIDSAYTRRPYNTTATITATNTYLTNIKQNIDNWSNNFPNIKGIFIDQGCSAPQIINGQSNICLTSYQNSFAPISQNNINAKDVVQYYNDIYKYAKYVKNLNFVTFNPGQSTPIDFYKKNTGTNIVIFEDTETNLLLNINTVTANPDRNIASVLIHTANVNFSDTVTVLNTPTPSGTLMQTVNQIYVTSDIIDGVTGTPWDTLPVNLDLLACYLADNDITFCQTNRITR